MLLNAVVCFASCSIGRRLPLRNLTNAQLKVRRLSSLPTADKLKDILANGRHQCPGCGTAFHLDETRATSGGYVCWSRLGSRIQWVPDAGSGEPHFMLQADIVSKEQKGNKFTRLMDWKNRTYTRLEHERIAKRWAMAPGSANDALQMKLKSGVTGIDDSPTESDAGCSADVRADTECLVARDDQAQFVEEPEETLDGDSEVVPTNSHIHSQNSRLFRKLFDASQLQPLRCSRCRELAVNAQLSVDKFIPAVPSGCANDFTGLSERDRAAIEAHLGKNALIVVVLDMLNLPSSIPDFAHINQLFQSLSYGGRMPDVVVVGNKLDLMPREFSSVRLLKLYLRNICQSHIPDIWAAQIKVYIPLSAHTEDGVQFLRSAILEWAHEHVGSVFLFGNVNSGKSKIYNTLLLRDKSSKHHTPATVSSRAGTTLGVLHACLDKIRTVDSLPAVNGRLRLFDLPGLFSPQRSMILHPDAPLSDLEASKIVIRTRCEAQKRVLLPGESGYLAAVMRIDCISSATESAAVKLVLRMFVRKDVPYMRLKTGKVDSTLADNLCFSSSSKIESSSRVVLAPPVFSSTSDPRLSQFTNLKVALSLTVTADGPYREVSFADGLGWASVSLVPHDRSALMPASEPVTVNFCTPSGTGVTERLPLTFK